MRHAGNDEFLLREGSAVRCVAIHGATAEYTEARQRAPVIEPAPDTALGRVLKTKQVIQIADIQKVPAMGPLAKVGHLTDIQLVCRCPRFGSKADIALTPVDVRFTPKTDIRQHD
jgi:hypothetical protein